MVITPKEIFRRDFFLYIIDVANNSLSERFETLTNYHNTFSFLWDIDAIEKKENTDKLFECCQKLENMLTNNSNSDIDANELFLELPTIATIIKKYEVCHPIDVLNMVMKLDIENVVPNVVIAYRIMLTLPVSVATGERSFSKLKLIKNHLRSTMGQERLNALALISIEQEIANKINFDEVIDSFAALKARKRQL